MVRLYQRIGSDNAFGIGIGVPLRLEAAVGHAGSH